MELQFFYCVIIKTLYRFNCNEKVVIKISDFSNVLLFLVFNPTK